MDNKTLYEVLGINRDADQVAIKRAYRHLAREHHPDTAASAADTDKFAEIREAYQTLSDQEMRRTYDKSLASGSLFSRKYELLKRPKSRERKGTAEKPRRSKSPKVSSRILRTEELDEQLGETIRRSLKRQGPDSEKQKEQAGQEASSSEGKRERNEKATNEGSSRKEGSERGSGIFDFIRKFKAGGSEENAREQKTGLRIVELDALESLRPCKKNHSAGEQLR